MRVIAGKYKGCRLKCLKGHTIRPAPDRLKEALFNILQPHIEDAAVLDLCSGTGSMGIEALSRGARQVTFVDSWSPAVNVLRENLRRCGIESDYQIMLGDALVALRRLASEGTTFDIIFFDPPYASDLYEPVLEFVGKGNSLRSNGLVIVMHHGKKHLAESYGKLHRVRTLKQGENILSFYQIG